MALASLLDSDGAMAAQPKLDGNPLAPRKGHHPAKAKRIIYLHMAGSPSQLELLEHKPVLKKFDGKKCPQQYLEGKRFAFIRGVPNMLATPYKFKQHGEAGTWVSELLPHFSEVVDDVAVINSLHTDQFNHAPAQLFMHTGQPRLGYASMGSWVTYGIGSENQNLPGFVVLASGGKTPSAGKSLWGSGFLPTVYQGVQCRTTGDPVLFLSDPKGIDRTLRRKTLDAIKDLNQQQLDQIGDPETLTRIAQYELAYRMQLEVPEVMDISKESAKTIEMYGAVPGAKHAEESAGDPRDVASAKNASFANNCLLARRLLEAGVRFVQLYHWGWDHHGSSRGEDIRHNLPIKTQQTDRPIAALIKDLKQRGMLEDTLVVWGGEFGRTPMRENRGGRYGKFVGRDHHPFGFTMWMAGGGIKGGQTYGKTDDIGYYPTENPMTIRDLQRTILHLAGIDPFKLSYSFQGLNQRLVGPTNEAKLHKALLA